MQAQSDTVRQRWTEDGQHGRYTAEVAATGLSIPFGMTFLPDGRLVVSDRPARRLQIVDPGTGHITPIEGGPTVFDSVDAGQLDVLAHPDFARNRLLYYAYTERTDSGITTVVERARLEGTRLQNRQRLFNAWPSIDNVHHAGARLVLHQGYLFVTLGERDIRDLAQELWTHHGKIIRLFEDGRVPPDNPFSNRPWARPEIWSRGHRNPHGLAVHPVTGELWETEHGPLGGDEINRIRPGANYGWPVTTHGREYQGHPIGGGLIQAAGMEPPVHHYTASAALSGMLFYTGAAFPEWQGSLFVGAMTPRFLGRLTIDSTGVREERLLLGQRWRVRVIQQGPDGFIYLGVDRSSRGVHDGKIIRLRPAAVER
jgi:glucose/arabinose dehydrogenase